MIIKNKCYQSIVFICLFLIFISSKFFYFQNPFKLFKIQNFNINRNVLVFLHIQKTGGRELDTFLIENLVYFDGDVECKIIFKEQITKSDKKKGRTKQFRCNNNRNEENSINWYWGRKTAGWPCGVHPHYKILKSCLKKFYPHLNPERDFFLFTMLREPIKRYLSEWHHASQGIRWIGPTQYGHCLYDNYKKCFKNKSNWKSVKLEEFIECRYNLGNNRQTLLLSDTSYECENKTGEQMLQEAKKNLQSLTFFGLTEYQNYTQQLFLKIFSNNFRLVDKFTQSQTFAEKFIKSNDSVQMPYLDKIIKLNKLDIELYAFGKELFFQRLKFYGIV